jgi:hypothetical protein
MQEPRWPPDHQRAAHTLPLNNMAAEDLKSPHLSDQRVYLLETLLMSFLNEAVHLERCSPWVDLSVLS